MSDLQKYADLHFFLEAYSQDTVFDYQMVKMASNTATILSTGEDFKSKIKDPELASQFGSFMDAYKEFASLLSFKKENLTEEAFQKSGEAYQNMQKVFAEIIKSGNPYLELNDDFDTGRFSEFLRDVLTDANDKILALSEGDGISDMRAAEVAEEFNDQGRQEDITLDWSAKKVQNARESQKKSYEELKFLKKVDPNHPRVLAAEESRKRANEREKELARTNPEEYARRREARRLKSKENSERYYEKVLSGYSLSKRQMMGMLNALKTKRSRTGGKLEEIELATLERLERILGNPKDRENAPGLIDHTHFKKNLQQAEKIRETRSGDDLKALIHKLQSSLASQKTVLKDILAGTKLTGKTPLEIKNALSTHKDWDKFQPYVEALSMAEKSGDLLEIQEARRVLEIILNRYASENDEVAAFDILAKDFYAFRNAANQIEKGGWDNALRQNPDGSEEQAALREPMRKGIESVIALGKEVIANHQMGELANLGKSKLDPDNKVNQRSVKLIGLLVNRVNDIVRHLEDTLFINDTLWKSAGKMTLRMKIIAGLLAARKRQ